MEDRIMDQYRIWREHAKEDPDVEKELQEMEGAEARIEDAFYRDLAFGTGGGHQPDERAYCGEGVPGACGLCEKAL